MESSSLDGGDDGEHNGVDFVEISTIFATQGAFFFGTELFNRIYQQSTQQIMHIEELNDMLIALSWSLDDGVSGRRYIRWMDAECQQLGITMKVTFITLSILISSSSNYTSSQHH